MTREELREEFRRLTGHFVSSVDDCNGFNEEYGVWLEDRLIQAEAKVRELEEERQILVLNIPTTIQQIRNDALEEAAKLAENMEDIVDPVTRKVWYPNAHDAADAIRSLKEEK